MNGCTSDTLKCLRTNDRQMRNRRVLMTMYSDRFKSEELILDGVVDTHNEKESLNHECLPLLFHHEVVPMYDVWQ